MSDFEATIQGKEHMILVPVEPAQFSLHTSNAVNIKLDPGLHCVAISGYAGISSGGDDYTELLGGHGFRLGDVNDDNVFTHTVSFIVGPEWRDLVQVCPSASRAGIESGDSEEVNQSRWVVKACDWEVAEQQGVELIRLIVTLETQGAYNGWRNIGYQVVATGNLIRLPHPDEVSAVLP